MSVSNITSSNGVGQSDWRLSVRQAHQDFEQLFQSLQSGDVSGAQQAYAALQQLQAANAPTATSATSAVMSADAGSIAAGSTNPVAADWTALGQALQSGNATSAQDAFTKLEQDLQTAVKNAGHHHHRHAVGQAQTTNAVTQAGSSDAAGSNQSAVSSDLNALKQALGSGDSSSAQDLLTKLEQDLQSSGQAANFPHRHHHGGFGGQSVVAAYGAGGSVSAGTA